MIEEIREAIRNCGKTPRRLALEAGVASSVVYRFLNGTRDPTLTSIDKIARAAGLRLGLEKK